ncbi:hypothetical protein [Sphingomonas sp. Root1294]|uniref:hypothetical protein n=1 Tax=Sphingomonas sp. Root1294 TaxID=1736447 RepID=UPI001F2BDDC4|nr:hypothetical protein [Sphingomonas sp. Root1294]
MTAEIEIGVSCRFVLRLSAVTMISSLPVSAGPVACWARAALLIPNIAVAVSSLRRLCAIFIDRDSRPIIFLPVSFVSGNTLPCRPISVGGIAMIQRLSAHHHDASCFDSPSAKQRHFIVAPMSTPKKWSAILRMR